MGFESENSVSKVTLILGLIACILVIIGALNWGWIAITSNNLVNSLNNAVFKNDPIERWFYGLIGLAGLYLIYFNFVVAKKMK